MLPVFHSHDAWRHPPQQQTQQQTPMGPSPHQHHQQPALLPSQFQGVATAFAVGADNGPASSQLAFRFARMLTDRQRVRGLLLCGDGLQQPSPSESVLLLPQASRGSTQQRALRRKRTRSKNCATTRRHRGSARLSRLAKARPSQSSSQDDDDDEGDRARLQATIRELQTTIANLERSQLLADSALLTWRANRTGVAVEICQQYFAHFARGYDPSNPMLVQRSAMTRAFMCSVVEEDVVCRDYQGLDTFLSQWQKYTTSYENFSSRMCSLTLVDEEDQYVSVRAAAEMRFAFNDVSLKMLYPRFYQQMQVSPEVKAIGEKLLGKECRLAFDLVLHFNQQGRVFAHESRVHLASALLDVISDPFAVMKVLNASLMTEDGHWQTADDSDIKEKSHAHELPKHML